MGCCHGAFLIDGKIIGDCLDVKMLEFSRFTIKNPLNDKDTFNFSTNNNLIGEI